MPTFPLQIISPEGTIWSGQSESITAIGVDGSFGVLAKHRPMIAALIPGPVAIQWGEKRLHFAVGEGILEVRVDKRVVILVDYAEACDSVEEAKAKSKAD